MIHTTLYIHIKSRNGIKRNQATWEQDAGSGEVRISVGLRQEDYLYPSHSWFQYLYTFDDEPYYKTYIGHSYNYMLNVIGSLKQEVWATASQRCWGSIWSPCFEGKN